MKKILLMLGVLVLIPFVTADINMTIGVDTDGGDADIWVNPNTGDGETTYYLDGKDFDETVDGINNKMSGLSGLGIDRVYRELTSLFMEDEFIPNKGKVWYKVNPEEESLWNRYMHELRWALDTHFMPRTELYDIIDRQQQQIEQLDLEIRGIQKQFTEWQVCTGRLSVAKDLNIEKVNCGNKTYHNNEGGGFVYIQPINSGNSTVNETVETLGR